LSAWGIGNASEPRQPARRTRFSRFAARFCCGVLSAAFFVCFFEFLVFAMGIPLFEVRVETAACRVDPHGLSNRIAREDFAAKLRVEGQDYRSTSSGAN
jgi:hypothetical protein